AAGAGAEAVPPAGRRRLAAAVRVAEGAGALGRRGAVKPSPAISPTRPRRTPAQEASPPRPPAPAPSPSRPPPRPPRAPARSPRPCAPGPPHGNSPSAGRQSPASPPATPPASPPPASPARTRRTRGSAAGGAGR